MGRVRLHVLAPSCSAHRARTIVLGPSSLHDACRGALPPATMVRGDRLPCAVATRHVASCCAQLPVNGALECSEDVYAELVVSGERRAHAIGCNSDIMGQRLWPTPGLVGQSARLRVVDRRGGEFGHIVLDELVQWVQRGPPPRAEHVEAAR